MDYEMPTYDEMMQPTLDALHLLGGEGTNEQILHRVIEQLNLPEEVVLKPHKPGDKLTELEYRLQWSRTYLRRCGFIQKTGVGIWRLTEQGQQVGEIDSNLIVKTVRAQLKAESKTKDGQVMESETSGNAIPTDEIDSKDETTPTETDSVISPTPLFPTYTEVRDFLRILDGVPYSHFRNMSGELRAQRGSPQEQVDWANPDEWIPKRLAGTEQELASRLYQESQGRLNPRHSRGCWYFVTKHNLLDHDLSNRLYVTTRGKEFLEQPSGTLVTELDAFEGVLFVLRLVAEKSPARRGDLLGEFSEYNRNHTTFRSDSVLKSSLYARLRNLVDRGLVSSQSQRYEITDAGLTYLEQNVLSAQVRDKVEQKRPDIHRLAKELRDEGRSQLHAYLQEMNPYKFEHLIRHLLVEMGYTNVETTAPTNDKGVDVVANIELGISSVREVIQVKRHRGAIGRPTLDQLRGSLYRFNAVRGTIITTGHFSKGALEVAFERGVAPITLIDGDKLLELLVENEIGIRKHPVEYYSFAPDKIDHLGAPDPD
jgi:restriction system protein